MKKISKENREELHSKLTKILMNVDEHISDKVKRREIKIMPETRLYEGGLNLDSLDSYEFRFQIEDQLRIKIDYDEFCELNTVGEVEDYLAKEEIFGRR